ncbi:thermonuclease family protein [Klebsiella pneumoniae]|uniref:thermonuclease family protein n=1 Tax=Klebsiella pneumoniae TaxID=573 RepID=UPI000AEF3E13
MKRKFCSLVLFVVAFSASADISGRIVRVLDGDTVEIIDPGNRLTRVRLAGIDAPEKSQPFGQRSRQELSSMVAQRLVTVTGSETDRYGRLLGTIWLGMTDVNAEQVRKGWPGHVGTTETPSGQTTLFWRPKPAVSQSDSGQNRVRQSRGAGVVCIRMSKKRIKIKVIIV